MMTCIGHVIGSVHSDEQLPVRHHVRLGEGRDGRHVPLLVAPVAVQHRRAAEQNRLLHEDAF